MEIEQNLTVVDAILLMEKAKSLGVKTVKWQGFEVEFPTADISNNRLRRELDAAVSPEIAALIKEISPPLKDMKSSDLVRPPAFLDQMSEEEILFYATPHFDEIQAQKEAHSKKLKEEGMAS